MDKNTLFIISALLTSPFIGAWVQNYFNKRKNGAEVQNLNISGEISIGDAWKDYAKNQEEVNKILRQEFKELQTNILKLSLDFEVMNREKDAEIAAKDKKIQGLEHRIECLEAEIETHKNNK